jgi:hypothetical protein
MNASKVPTRSPGRRFLVAAVILVLGTVAAGMYLSAAWGCTLTLLPAVGACAGHTLLGSLAGGAALCTAARQHVLR